MVEFWNSLLTEKSWSILQELKKEHDFILIGGWAVYLFTNKQKSKDIDIIISINELQKFKSQNLSKNDKLKKYEIKKGEIDIDIYVEHYSKFAIPSEDMRGYTTKIQGYDVIIPEMLLILKQNAYNDRKNSIKGEKDLIDIMSLLFFSEIDFKKYLDILKKYKIEDYYQALRSMINSFKDYDKLEINPREFKLRKNKLLGRMLK